jgi:hypothetical protein
MSRPERSQQTEDLERYEQRFLELKQEFQHLECFCQEKNGQCETHSGNDARLSGRFQGVPKAEATSEPHGAPVANRPATSGQDGAIHVPRPIIKSGISSYPAFQPPPEAIRSSLTCSVYVR